MRRAAKFVAAGLAACAVPEPGPPGDDPVDDTDRPTETDPAVHTDDTDDEDRPPRGLTVGPELACGAAPSAMPFAPLDGGPAWAGRAYDARSNSLFVGGGLAAADFTGDDRPDLLLTADELGVAYWVQGPDGAMVERSADLPPLPHDTTGITAVDLDDDGDLDAVVTSFRDGVFALRNDGSGRFTDATEALGLGLDTARRWMSSAWADLDGDGDLDAFFAAYGALSRGDGGGLPPGDASAVLVHDGAGYRDLVPALPDDLSLKTGHTFAGLWSDLDDDGRPDLFLVNDFGWRWPSLALWNTGGALGARDRVGFEQGRENMGAAVGDVDGDGLPDVVVAAWDEIGLYVSREGRWFDVADARSLRLRVRQGQNVAWGPDLGDLDNDGDLDVAVAIGFLDVSSDNTNPENQPDAVWLQGPDGTFTDTAPAWGLDHPGRSRAVLFVDWNRDGFLDLLRTDLRGPPAIFLNTCTDAAWLRVALRQDGPNPFAIGARVRVTGPVRSWTSEVRAGGTSYGAGGPPEVHVGLGTLDRVDLEIRWPDGTLETYADVPTRRAVTVRR